MDKKGLVAQNSFQASPSLCLTGPNLSLPNMTRKSMMLAWGKEGCAADEGALPQEAVPQACLTHHALHPADLISTFGNQEEVVGNKQARDQPGFVAPILGVPPVMVRLQGRGIHHTHPCLPAAEAVERRLGPTRCSRGLGFPARLAYSLSSTSSPGTPFPLGATEMPTTTCIMARTTPAPIL